jgi:nicotinic acid phosphoribosyltransferase
MMLLSSYKNKKDDAIKQIEEFISKNDELNWKQEEERNNLIYKYNLLQQYKDKMQSNVLIAQERFAKKLHEMFEFVKDLSFSEQMEYIEKHKNDDKRV